MENLFPRDGLLEKDIEATTGLSNVEARQDVRGNVWLIVNRDELDDLLRHLGEIDRFLERAEAWSSDIPDRLGT